MRGIWRWASLALLALLVGCGPAAGGPRQVTFMVFGDPAEKAAFEQLVQAFEQRQGTVRVALTHIPSQADYRKRIAADFAAGTPSDIVLINYRRVSTFAASGAIEPLGPFLGRSTVVREADFYPQALDAFRYGGALQCIPQNISSLVVYYNQKLFDEAGVPRPEAGWTWDTFLAAARALTRDVDGDGRIDQYGVAVEPTLIRVAPFIWQNGGEVIDNPAAPTGLALDTPEAKAAIQWFVELQTVHRVAPGAEEEGSEDSESRFQNGRAAMLLDSRRAVPALRQINAFAWDVAPLPQGLRPATILHSDAYCMAARSQSKDAAWAFIEFANSVDGQTIIAKTGRTVPSLRSVAESPVFLEPEAAPKSSAVFVDAIPSIRATPTLNRWEEIEALLDGEIERAFYGQASVDEAVAAAQERTARFFAP